MSDDRGKPQPPSLTKRQQQFVTEYLRDFSAKEAAIRCGYSDKSAKQQGYRLLQDPLVADAIDVQRKRLSERTTITAEWVLTQIRDIAADPEGSRFERLKALELLGKNLKLFTDKHEVTGKDGAPLAFSLVLDLREDG